MTSVVLIHEMLRRLAFDDALQVSSKIRRMCSLITMLWRCAVYIVARVSEKIEEFDLQYRH